MTIFRWSLKRLFLILVQHYSLFIAFLYSLTSITAARFGEIVIRASPRRSGENLKTALLVSSNYDAGLDELFHSLKWHRPELQRNVDLSILMHIDKALNNETPEYLSSKFINHMGLTPVWLKNYGKQTGSTASRYWNLQKKIQLWSSCAEERAESLKAGIVTDKFRIKYPLPQFPRVSVFLLGVLVKKEV